MKASIFLRCALSFLSVSVLILPTTALHAQVFTPPAQQPASGGNQNSGGGGNTTTVNSQSQQSSGNNQLLGNSVPYFDNGTETFTFDGKSWNINNNRLFAARFEKYLNTPPAESEEDQAYRKVLREILDALSPHTGANLPRAVALLQNAATFDQDAFLCESLANAVYRVYLAKSSVADLQRLNVELDKQRRSLDWNYKVSNEAQQTREDMRSRANARAGVGPDDTAEDAGAIQRYVQRIAEVEAERVANRAKMEVSEIQAKLEFQALMVQFFMQRRFEHVIIAARIYTEFFQDGNGELEFKEGSEVEKSFSKSIGFSPTVTTLDAFSNEAIRDVKDGVEAFKFLVTKNELDSATKRLSESFMLGEYLEPIRTLEMESKQKVLGYARDSFQLLSAIEVKDYTLAEELVTRMRETAKDFDFSKPTAAIETARLSANMLIRTARNAALKGDEATYSENIAKAAEIWPTNPQLKEQFDLIADQSDVMQVAKREFDRLLSTESYRAIYNDKGRFIAATLDDAERQESLQQILENIQVIEIAMQQADALAKGGNPYAAWETIEQVFQKFPDDSPLGTVRSDLATDVAEFVSTLKTAENLESRDQTGSSLAWFLKSRKIYPNSLFAREGIERLVEKILPDKAPVGGSSAASTTGSGDDVDFFENSPATSGE